MDEQGVQERAENVPLWGPSVEDQRRGDVTEFKQVPAAMLQHLVESLPRRVEAVIAAKGGPTSY
jgi:hypothetical protein